MLDLNQVSRFLPEIGQHLRDEATAASKRLDRARSLVGEAAADIDRLLALHAAWGDRLPFAAATPTEPLDRAHAIAPPHLRHTVIATDGSQISPSHHEIAYCYLINTGRIALHYGQNRHPLLDSLPEAIYKSEDLYLSRQWGISTEEWMGHRRTVSEAIALAELGETQRAESGETADEPRTLALTDGSLIYWFLDNLPSEARDRVLPPILDAWDTLADARVPLVGYLSASRSGEATHFLRLAELSRDGVIDFDRFEVDDDGDRAQSFRASFEPMRDTSLWGSFLEPGQRSALWKSHNAILKHYGDRHAVYFCYVHVGTEIARIDLPAWVAEDDALREFALGATISQVQKGYGYPVSLAEAHNQAVVRGGDRQRFFALLEQQMIKAGLKNIGTSYKESRKRRSIA
ncbi:MAG: DNA double-strand break repair nuclease NurA [Geitlerinemataceae cyanobacterium]